jgi:hypothetical protein
MIMRPRRPAAKTSTVSALDLAMTVLTALTLIFVIYFGLYPRPPVEAPLDPDTLYRGGEAIGHVTDFRIEPVPPGPFSPSQYGQYVFRGEERKPIEQGDALRFRHTVCYVLDLGKPQPQLSKFDGLTCRIDTGEP